MRHRPNVAKVIDEYRGGIHLAKLRLDVFVSLRGDSAESFVYTRPLLIEGRRLLINGVTEAGKISAEITDASGRHALPGWSREECTTVTGDQLAAELVWAGRELSELEGKKVRIRFYLENADLYSFWVKD